MWPLLLCGVRRKNCGNNTLQVRVVVVRRAGRFSGIQKRTLTGLCQTLVCAWHCLKPSCDPIHFPRVCQLLVPVSPFVPTTFLQKANACLHVSAWQAKVRFACAINSRIPILSFQHSGACSSPEQHCNDSKRLEQHVNSPGQRTLLTEGMQVDEGPGWLRNGATSCTRHAVLKESLLEAALQ